MENNEDIYKALEVINNLSFVRSHIKKFGITPQFLHLVDDNKQLSNSLKVALEEDIDIEKIEEAFKETINKAYNSISNKIKAIKDSLIIFFQKIMINVVEIEKQVILVEHILAKLPSDFNKADSYIKGLDKETNYYNYKEFKELVSQIEKDSKINIPTIKGTDKFKAPLEFKSLLTLGYIYKTEKSVKLDDDTKVYHWGSYEIIKQTSNLNKEVTSFKKLGWNIENMKTSIKDMKMLLSLPEVYKKLSFKVDETLLIILEKTYPDGYTDSAYSDDDTAITNLTLYYNNIETSIKRVVEAIPKIVSGHLTFLIRSLAEFK